MQPPHIPGISNFPDLSMSYSREWRVTMLRCQCDGSQLVARYTKAVRSREALLAPRRERR